MTWGLGLYKDYREWLESPAGRKVGTPSSHAIAPMEKRTKDNVHALFASLFIDRATAARKSDARWQPNDGFQLWSTF